MKLVLLLCLLAACPGKQSGDKPKPTPEPATRDGAAMTGDGAIALAPAPPVPEVPVGLPQVPEHAGITPEAIALGELLFWDSRLSSTNLLSCAECHEPDRGFAGDRQHQTAGGKPNLRRAPPLVNLAWEKELGWDGRFASVPELLDAHVLGQMGSDLATAVARITEVPGYRAHFARVGGSPPEAAANALVAYVLTRYSGNAAWDRVEKNPPAELKAGYQLFIGKAQCAVCHVPPLYTDHQYHRLGLIATPDEGRGRVDATQKGAFRTPTLRDASSRDGFFHDGSVKTLDEAIDWHLAGGRGQNADPSIVDVKKIALSQKERADLGVFVRALTDQMTMTKTTKPELP